LCLEGLIEFMEETEDPLQAIRSCSNTASSHLQERQLSRLMNSTNELQSYLTRSFETCFGYKKEINR
ncbi:Hypothetical predicted protein, partial [Podarcis lilfordi]